jgi:O-antigen chain-terminating methyltransferase
MNPMMVARCRDLGLEVDEAEALSWLCSLPAESLAGITGFHVIEHFPFPVLTRIFDECLRVLAPGGLVVFETPNPANLLVASERFYLDPTHINPLPDSTVSFLAEVRGFTRVSILQLHPVANVKRRVYDDPLLALLQEKMYGPQAYGLLAWKVK